MKYQVRITVDAEFPLPDDDESARNRCAETVARALWPERQNGSVLVQLASYAVRGSRSEPVEEPAT